MAPVDLNPLKKRHADTFRTLRVLYLCEVNEQLVNKIVMLLVKTKSPLFLLTTHLISPDYPYLWGSLKHKTNFQK